jgi:hypothetical protein
MTFPLAMSRSGVVAKGALIIVVAVVAYISARDEFVATIGRKSASSSRGWSINQQADDLLTYIP